MADYKDPFGSGPSDVDSDETSFDPLPPPSSAPRPPPTPSPGSRIPRPQVTTQRGYRDPAGAERTLGRSPASAPDPTPFASAPVDFVWRQAVGDGPDNPIVAAARTAFVVASQLRATPAGPDVTVFRQQMMDQIKSFDGEMRKARVHQEVAQSARYALCSFIDEMVLLTPWGNASAWKQTSLLQHWHKDGWGGERFFTIVQHALGDPGNNLHLLEFLFLCVCFGFKGNYRVSSQGSVRLAELQDAMYRAIRSERGDQARDLSVRWRGVDDRRNPIVRYVPLWVVGAICATVLASAFLGFWLMLGKSAAPVVSAVAAMGRDTLQLAANAAPVVVPAGVKRLKAFLEDEVAEGLVTVDELPDRAVVRIRGDQLFASGSAAVTAAVLPTLQRVAGELKQVGGRVEVIGHSDNQPVRSLRFASNEALSRARADGVVTALANFGVEANRLSADGRADAEPLADNATAEGRAANRRVEIVVYEGYVPAVPSAAPATY